MYKNKVKTSIMLFIFSMFYKLNTVFASCNTAIFGSKTDDTKLAYWIFEGLKVIKYIVPALVIILCMVDFFKAVIAGSEDKMKAAQKTAIQRIIIGVAFFFIESFVALLLGAASGDLGCYMN